MNNKNKGKDITVKDVSMCGAVCDILDLKDCDNLKTFVDKLCSYLNTGYGSVLFQTNGIDNGIQNILNLVDGDNISITDDGEGNISINVTGLGNFSETWQQTLINGSNLTQNNIVNANGNNFSITDLRLFSIEAAEEVFFAAQTQDNAHTVNAYFIGTVANTTNPVASILTTNKNGLFNSNEFRSSYNKQIVTNEEGGAFSITTPSPTNGDYYAPLSVNGNFADNTGNITTGGGGGNTIYTGDDSLLGARSVDLAGNSLRFLHNSQPFLIIDPAPTAEQIDILAFSSEASISSGLYITAGSDAGYRFELTSDNAIKNVKIVGSALDGTIRARGGISNDLLGLSDISFILNSESGINTQRISSDAEDGTITATAANGPSSSLFRLNGNGTTITINTDGTNTTTATINPTSFDLQNGDVDLSDIATRIFSSTGIGVASLSAFNNTEGKVSAVSASILRAQMSANDNLNSTSSDLILDVDGIATLTTTSEIDLDAPLVKVNRGTGLKNIAVSVNGNYANSAGDITLSTATAERFGFSGEDDTGAEDRLFTNTTHETNIVSAGISFEAKGVSAQTQIRNTTGMPWLVFKNDDGETPSPTTGALISGSAFGGAIRFRNNTANTTASMDLGQIHNDASWEMYMTLRSNQIKTTKAVLIIDEIGLEGTGNGTIIAQPASAVLDIRSSGNNKGVLFPRMTTTQMNAISSPAEGLMIYNTTVKTPFFFNGTDWIGM